MTFQTKAEYLEESKLEGNLWKRIREIYFSCLFVPRIFFIPKIFCMAWDKITLKYTVKLQQEDGHFSTIREAAFYCNLSNKQIKKL